MNKEEIKLNLSATDNWVRGVFVFLYVIVFNLLGSVIFLIVVFQFATLLITGKINDAVYSFVKNLNVYVWEILEYITFNSDEKPFPFKPFPKMDNEESRENNTQIQEATNKEPEKKNNTR